MPALSKEKFASLVSSTFDKSLIIQRPAAVKHVARLRRVHPEWSPIEMIRSVNRWYLGAVTGSGAAAGLSSVFPNGAVQIPAALGDLGVFLESSVLYTLTLAEIHNLHPEDIERRRLLVYLVLAGDSAGSKGLQAILGRSVPHWGKVIVNAVPMEAINAANKFLGPRFITRYGTTQGVLVLGKQVPMGLGALVGAGGNHLFGRVTVRAAQKVLGTPPLSWPETVTPPTVIDGEVV